MSVSNSESLRRPPGILGAILAIFALGLILRLLFGGGLSMLSASSPIMALDSTIPYLFAGLWLGHAGGKQQHVVLATSILVSIGLLAAAVTLKNAGSVEAVGPLLQHMAPYLIATLVAGPAGFQLGKRLKHRLASDQHLINT